LCVPLPLVPSSSRDQIETSRGISHRLYMFPIRLFGDV